jgi:hypothetical protein
MGPAASTLRGMEGGFSWLVLVAAFAFVAAGCGMLAAKLIRVGSGRRPPGGAG